MQLSVRRLAPGELDHELIWLSASVLSLGFAAVWLTLGLPWPRCVFHNLTNLPCVTCGMTRCGIQFFHGHFLARIAMEPIRVRGSLRRDCVRRIRACNSRSAHTPTADPSFDAARENIFACLSHLCARAKLDLFAAALAQLLNVGRLCQTRALSKRPTSRSAKSVSIRVHLWLIWRHANPGHRRRRLYRVASCREAARCRA